MKLLKKYLLLIALVLSVSLQSCATLLTGTTDSITINSEPQGARVEVNGISRGKTPVTLTMNRAFWQDSRIKLTLEGYKDVSFRLERNFNYASILDIFIMPIGFIIDAFTGSITKFDPTQYNIILEKNSNQT